MRPDGTRVKEASTIVSALPYVMPRRYDAQNFITEYADMEVLRRYIQEKRREGVHIPYMTLILAAYFKAYQENPKINRFIMNSKIYQRNHFCVSFVILKTRADGRADETSIKVFFEDGDDIFSINRKIEEAVAQNQVAAQQHYGQIREFSVRHPHPARVFVRPCQADGPLRPAAAEDH